MKTPNHRDAIVSTTVTGILKWPCHILLAFALLLVFYHQQEVEACTRVLWRTSESLPPNGTPPAEQTPVIVGRTHDWGDPAKAKFRLFPQGIQRDGLAGDNSLHWKSEFSSLVITALDAVTFEGLNEKGLSARFLYLAGTDYGQRDLTRPGLSQGLFVQYILDNFATVAQAVQSLEAMNVQLIPIQLLPSNGIIPLHFSIEDAGGDSAIIEYVTGGQMKVYHDRKYRVMTNDPTFDLQLANLLNFDGFGGTNPLPGTVDPADRFVRASFYVGKMLPPPNSRQAASFMTSLLSTVVTPPAVLGVGPTWWKSVMDLTNRVYYFSFQDRLVWVNLDKFIAPGSLERRHHRSPERTYDLLKDSELTGDISQRLKRAEPFVFKTAVEYDFTGG